MYRKINLKKRFYKNYKLVRFQIKYRDIFKSVIRGIMKKYLILMTILPVISFCQVRAFDFLDDEGMEHLLLEECETQDGSLPWSWDEMQSNLPPLVQTESQSEGNEDLFAVEAAQEHEYSPCLEKVPNRKDQSLLSRPKVVQAKPNQDKKGVKPEIQSVVEAQKEAKTKEKVVQRKPAAKPLKAPNQDLAKD